MCVFHRYDCVAFYHSLLSMNVLHVFDPPFTAFIIVLPQIVVLLKISNNSFAIFSAVKTF